MLQHRGDALQPHAGIDAGLWQRVQHALLVLVELHEDQVPDFDVTVAVFVGAARRAAPDFGAVVVENLAARAARAGLRHLPEVIRRITRALVVADADDTLGRDADFVFPDRMRFVVLGIHGHPQLFLRQLVDRSQQFPCVVDRIALEIIAEREIAQHFKESMVARGVADVFQIVVLAAGAQAALRGGRAAVGALVLAQKHVLELHHAGVGKQQGRIIAGNQAR